MRKTSILLTFLFLWSTWTTSPKAGDEGAGYFKVTCPCSLSLPEDHGAHPGYRTEWWYYTGNLRSPEGRRFGFQLTFFRTQISPPGAEKGWPDPPSAWRTQHLYLAHFALTDVEADSHRMEETAARNALGLAGARMENGRTTIFVKGWSAMITENRHLLTAGADGFAVDLTLSPRKPPVLHGRDGYSRKGNQPEQASCYYSLTRLDTRGTIIVQGKVFPVEGLSWMDHEFSSAPLAPGIIGWDWFSLQLENGSELMLFLLRQKNGRIHPASSGTFIFPSGRTRHLERALFRIDARKAWKSPRSGAKYPSLWEIRIPVLALDLTLQPAVSDQEMITQRTTGVIYWEGAVTARGEIDGESADGVGYVELTGYARDFDAPL